MAIPHILKVILGWLGDFSAVLIGEKVASSTDKDKSAADHTTSVIEAARKLAETEKFDRQGFLLELGVINTDTTTDELRPIFDLFHELWKKKGVIFVGRGKLRRSYRENQIGHLLQMVPIDQRQTEYVRLARLLAADREEFFSQLEILNNDRIQQFARQFLAELEDSELGKSIATAANELAEPLETITGQDGTLRNLRDRVRARATETRGDDKWTWF